MLRTIVIIGIFLLGFLIGFCYSADLHAGYLKQTQKECENDVYRLLNGLPLSTPSPRPKNGSAVVYEPKRGI